MSSQTPVHTGSDVSVLHQALVEELKGRGHIRSPRVEAAFRAIPRHLFLPGVPSDEVYRDQSIPTKRLDGRIVSSSSQPAIMAVMLEQLGLEPGHRVLEIGAATGYNAALMAHMVGDRGQVVTLDIDQDLVEGAREHLAAAGLDRVQVVCADGGEGYPNAAPYDRIILTVGAWDIAPAWRDQLNPMGRLVLPLSIRGLQLSIAFEQVDDHLESISVEPCGFIMLRGSFAGPDCDVQLGPEPGLSISADNPNLVDAGVAWRLLTSACRDWPTGVRVTTREVCLGLSFWLALRAPGFCTLNADKEMAEGRIIPDLFRFSSKFNSTIGLLGEASLCVLMRPPGQSSPADESNGSPFELFVRNLGQDDTLAHRLIEQIAVWDAGGRRSTQGVRIRAYPQDAGYVPSPDESVVVKRWTRLALDWV